MISIYLITRSDNACYIGITKGNLMQRWRRHIRDAYKGGNWILARAIRKYGANVFTITHIASAHAWDHACELERSFIEQYRTFCGDGNGYNMTRGGDGMLGHKQSISTISKKSASLMGHSVDEYTKLRIAVIGRASRGIPKAPQHKAKIGMAHKGKQKSPEAIAKMRLHRWESRADRSMPFHVQQMLRTVSIGRKRSDVHKAAIAAANRSRPPGTSGIYGVTAKGHKWQARYTPAGSTNRVTLGTFATKEQARNALMVIAR